MYASGTKIIQHAHFPKLMPQQRAGVTKTRKNIQ
jgi:hypothetical protein